MNDDCADAAAALGARQRGSLPGLADSACGFGCLRSLPRQASGFTTVELKANFTGTARNGGVACIARLVHGGRTTQVWDAEVRAETSRRTIALFRCTQLVLYPATSADAAGLAEQVSP